MNTTENLNQMQEMKMSGMARCYEAILTQPVHQHPEGHELLATLLESERLHRRNKQTEMLLRFSRLRYQAGIEQIICSPSRNLTKQTLASLADCSFIDRGENLLITAATGGGKSYLACALGHQACLLGYKALYLNMNRFIERIALAKTDGTFIKLINYLEKVKLIIFDDFGLQPLDHNTKLAILQILEDRYEKKSIIIASQLPTAKWHEYIFSSPHH
jgi:DNA replication protein DnaC